MTEWGMDHTHKFDFDHVKELLGHESLETVKHYTKLTINDLREAHARYHPREKDF